MSITCTCLGVGAYNIFFHLCVFEILVCQPNTNILFIQGNFRKTISVINHDWEELG